MLGLCLGSHKLMLCMASTRHAQTCSLSEIGKGFQKVLGRRNKLECGLLRPIIRADCACSLCVLAWGPVCAHRLGVCVGNRQHDRWRWRAGARSGFAIPIHPSWGVLWANSKKAAGGEAADFLMAKIAHFGVQWGLMKPVNEKNPKQTSPSKGLGWTGDERG